MKILLKLNSKGIKVAPKVITKFESFFRGLIPRAINAILCVYTRACVWCIYLWNEEILLCVCVCVEGRRIRISRHILRNFIKDTIYACLRTSKAWFPA